jgi:hypothetical protein
MWFELLVLLVLVVLALPERRRVDPDPDISDPDPDPDERASVLLEETAKASDEHAIATSAAEEV